MEYLKSLHHMEKFWKDHLDSLPEYHTSARSRIKERLKKLDMMIRRTEIVLLGEPIPLEPLVYQINS